MHNKRRPWPTKNRFFANRHRYPEFPSARASGEQATSRRLLSIVRVFRSASPDPSCFLSRDFRADRARARTSARIFQRHVARRSTSVLLLLLDDMRQRASHERCELRRQLAFHFRLTDLSRHARDRTTDTKQIGATDKSTSPTGGGISFLLFSVCSPPRSGFPGSPVYFCGSAANVGIRERNETRDERLGQFDGVSLVHYFFHVFLFVPPSSLFFFSLSFFASFSVSVLSLCVRFSLASRRHASVARSAAIFGWMTESIFSFFLFLSLRNCPCEPSVDHTLR